MYKKVRECIDTDKYAYNPIKRKHQKQYLIQLINEFCKPHKKDPKKLEKIKYHMQDRINEYLTCMDYEDIPCDNNKAERMLRHFVIKRLISF